MLLKPIQNIQPDPIQEALEISGLTRVKSDAPESVAAVEKVRAALNYSGASIDDAAIALGGALQNDDTKLQAARLAFELHGALKDKTKHDSTPSIQIVINGSSPQNNLMAILAPREISE